jgi:hypothetical protein
MKKSMKERFREVDRVPTPWDEPARGSIEPARLRGRTRIRAVSLAVASVAVAATVAVVVLNSGAGPGSQPVQGDASWLLDGQGSCVERYSPETLRGRSWAFEGVISSVDAQGEGTADPGGPPTTVTFDVVRWFWGGSERQISLRTYTSPSSAGEVEASLGARLLLPGEEDFLWQCGFTQPFTEERLQEFEAAASARTG